MLNDRTAGREHLVNPFSLDSTRLARRYEKDNKPAADGNGGGGCIN